MKIIYYSFVLFVFTLITFRVAQLVEGCARNLWVAGSNLAPVSHFIYFVKLYKCILGANVIDFDFFKSWP